ncbi:MAG: hypothetical protein Ct9H300mP7_0960 [Verrucomicrobiota bacterium]|nr:MAG: hypothetical protein Ct9H300mP7_0960 [Verrucomicrobiota bacterium]
MRLRPAARQRSSTIDRWGSKAFASYSRARALVGLRVVWWYSITPKLNARSMDTAPESSQELKQRSFVVPFGECIYQDPMFLPGVVTMNLLGHEMS